MIEKKKKKNRIILCLCSIFVLVASIFSFIPFVKESKQVYADSVTQDYSFSGSNISSKTTFNKGLFSYNLCPVNYINSNTIEYVYFSNPLPSGSYTLSAIVSSDSPDEQCLVEVYNHGYWVTQFKISKSNTREVAHRTISSDFDELRFYAGTNNFEFNFSFTDILLVSGDSDLPYVPYENSTYLNYEFDFSSIYDFDYEWSRIDTKFNINSSLDFARVSNNNYQSIQGDGKSYSFTTNTPGAVTQLTFSAINSATNVLDNNYIFSIYTFLDYIDNENYNPATYFTANIGSIVLGSYKDYATYFRNDYSLNTTFLMTGKYNFISYVDNNNNNLNFLIPLDSDNDSDYWQFRTYYTSNASVDTSGAYNNGYNQGYNTGYGVGERVGYDDGYKNGNTFGYNNGYNAGVQAGSDYSFLSLVSSVIDAPMTYFTSLFNFELLGVNLQGFLMALFTLCVVVTIVKLCLGR